MSEPDLEHIPLTGPFADLTTRIAFGEFPVPAPSMPDPVRVELDGEEISGFHSASVTLEDGVLTVLVSTTGQLPPLGKENKAEIHLADGSRITLSAPHSFSKWGDLGAIKAYVWDWTTDRTPKSLVAKPQHCRTPLGNLFVQNPLSSFDGFRGTGNYNWHIVNLPTGEQVALVDTPTPDVDVNALRCDLAAFEFVFGGDVTLDVLWKVDSAGLFAGGIGLGRAGAETHYRRPPIPSPGDPYRIYEAPLFSLVAKALAENNEAVLIASAGYRDTLTGNIDARLALGYIALEASCKLLVGSNEHSKPTYLVEKKKSWNRLVDSWKNQVTPLLKRPDDLTKVLENLKTAVAIRPSSSSRVARALQKFDFRIPNEVLEELKSGRSEAVHDYISFKHTKEPIQAAVDRLENLQTLLVAAVAAGTGYRGPIRGPGSLNAMWQPEELAEAKRHYRCGVPFGSDLRGDA